eukprot:TRINITY_DN21642_c0_g1_i1.p1 TRINITY_DN21642_c0_g1~~TRINITY_DN21642_c0_g1_i1.p1  ORF type:complete len:206 (+),score=35.63 TRINITY_DN21642_c0_g1_i1:66-683(+)
MLTATPLPLKKRALLFSAVMSEDTDKWEKIILWSKQLSRDADQLLRAVGTASHLHQGLDHLPNPLPATSKESLQTLRTTTSELMWNLNQLQIHLNRNGDFAADLHRRKSELVPNPLGVSDIPCLKRRSGRTRQARANAARKKPCTSANPSQLICYHCNTTDTPEWRRGPAGPKTLCNACGLQYAKRVKLAKQREGKEAKLEFILN